ncbi:MAG: hypothetical protein Q7U83_13450 [Daejeonella sp.]|nr:hypothetical protein [Daejeonella sp.]
MDPKLKSLKKSFNTPGGFITTLYCQGFKQAFPANYKVIVALKFFERSDLALII